MASSYRIMIFSWNTESVSLCETLDPNIAEYNRTSYSTYIPGLTTWKYPAEIPDFYPKLSEFITTNSPDLIIIGFQEDRYPGSYFHSHLLPIEMPKIGYGLVRRNKLMGVGVTTYKAIFKGDLFERGIRVSIYAKNNLASLIEQEETELSLNNEYICSSQITRGKGATVSYVKLPNLIKTNDNTIPNPILLAFICCHLPFNSRSLITQRLYKNRMLRQNEINISNICFNNIIENLVLLNDTKPTHVIYFGDFNYRLGDPRPASEVATDFINKGKDTSFLHDMYMIYDELKEQMRRQNIYEFLEGISNQGPLFLPTCKMSKNRDTSSTLNINYWKTGREDQRVPSWCDRILYQKFYGVDTDERNEVSLIGKGSTLLDDSCNLICTYYDRFDVGEVMAKSDHAAVIGLFELH